MAHFFLDGNTRTAYVFLNQMLIAYGFLPTILDDPNELEVTDIKTLFPKVISGQKKVFQLLYANKKILEKYTFPTMID